eukprot:PhM_4_TR18896/c0_g1_i1/m.20345
MSTPRRRAPSNEISSDYSYSNNKGAAPSTLPRRRSVSPPIVTESFQEVSRRIVGGAGLHTPQAMQLSFDDLKARHDRARNDRRLAALDAIAGAEGLSYEIKRVLMRQCAEEWVLELVDLRKELPERSWCEWCVIAAQHGADYPHVIRKMLRPLSQF